MFRSFQCVTFAVGISEFLVRIFTLPTWKFKNADLMIQGGGNARKLQ